MESGANSDAIERASDIGHPGIGLYYQSKQHNECSGRIMVSSSARPGPAVMLRPRLKKMMEQEDGV